MSYVTVFEVAQKPYQWWFPACGLFGVFVGIVVVWTNGLYGFLKPQKNVKRTGYFAVVFSSFWVLVTFGFTFSEYRKLTTAYRAGNYSIVEGTVESFSPLPSDAHGLECFSVGGKRFCYAEAVISASFSQTIGNGGPIRSGLPVRVGYVDDKIVLLQIRADAQH